MSMEEAIIQVFKNKPDNEFSNKEIYSGIENYYELTDFQKQPDPLHGQQRYKHEIRSILVRLEKQGIIKQLERNKRKLA